MTPPVGGRRIASLWLPHLACERWARQAARDRTLPSEAPIVLARDGPHGPVVHAANAVARGRGVAVGARVTDIAAIHPDLLVEAADPDGDAALLDRLALWARRWCPWTAADRAPASMAGIVLDITGSAHLFGGEAAMLDDMTRRFATQGLTIRAAIAPTRAAAWALARHGRGGAAIVAPGALEAALAPLPVGALGLSPATGRLLGRLGLATIGDLAALPRAPLMRRFRRHDPNDNPLLRLDRATGHIPDPLSPPAEPARWLARIRLAEPVMSADPLLPGLARDLAAHLEAGDLGARRLRLTLYRIDGEARWAEVTAARATRDGAHMARLLAGRLDHVDPGFGVDLVTLEAVRTEPLGVGQDSLDSGREVERDMARLIDRLTARLGARAVSRSAPVQSHLPERSERRVAAMAAPGKTAPPSGTGPDTGPGGGPDAGFGMGARGPTATAPTCPGPSPTAPTAPSACWIPPRRCASSTPCRRGRRRASRGGGRPSP